MPSSAPGVVVNVTAAASNPYGNAPTGTWFVLGNAQGPSGVPVPITSMNDFVTYFGSIQNGQVTGRYTITNVDSTPLYDALDVYFREGGILAYVSRVVSSTAVVAASGSAGLIKFSAVGAGTWANSASGSAAGVIITISSAVTGQYGVTIKYNGTTMATSPTLYSDTDVKNWVNSLPKYQALVVATTQSGTTNLPSAGNTTTIYVGSGTGSTPGTDVAVVDADADAALTCITDKYGVGQVSYPGNTAAAVYVKLGNHAAANSRVAILDAADTATAATLTSAVSTFQSAVTDPSYAAFFGPWLVVPGISNVNPASTSSVVFNRTVAPSALAAAKMALTDTASDCNVPAAGLTNGSSAYAVNTSQTYSSADRASLNNGGVNVIRAIPNIGTIAVYGFRSAALDPNWQYLNNVRFRMQIMRDFDIIAESFVFQEIDGRGQVFAKFAGALSGQCQAYWLRKSLYGATPGASFSVNTGTQVNTPATIAAGQINAQVNVRMSPFGEFVTVSVTKYLANAPLPTTSNA